MNQDAGPGVGYVDIVSLEEYTEKNTVKRETIHATNTTAHLRPEPITNSTQKPYENISRAFRTTFIWPKKTT